MKLDQTSDLGTSAIAGTQEAPRRFGVGALSWLAIGAILLAVLLYTGISTRARADATLKQGMQESSMVTVSVVRPKSGAGTQDVVLPGNVRAYTDTPIYARTSGYLKKWYVDIGGHVKTGQLLAEIETPELDSQLQQARAELATAEANYQLAQSTADRWKELVATDSVSKQETDEKLGDLNAKKATVQSGRYNVQRLEELHGYRKIFAPFAGVITVRNTDVGALIDAGANSAGRELFHLAATNKLRVYVSVPQANSRVAVPGVTADLSLAEIPGRTFTGKVVRTANAIDASSRTLLTEIEVDNTKGDLLPGAYVTVHLKMAANNGAAMTVPVNTLLFRSEGLRVAVVRDGHAVLQPIIIGRDFGTEVEVVHGLQPEDAVIANPPDSLVSGLPVRIAASADKPDAAKPDTAKPDAARPDAARPATEKPAAASGKPGATE
jgi:RND family efflux transporter MFP subunit